MACLSTRLIPRPTAASETKKLSTFDLSDNRRTMRFQACTHSDVSDLHSYSDYAATPPRSKRKRGVESLATAAVGMRDFKVITYVSFLAFQSGTVGT